MGRTLSLFMLLVWWERVVFLFPFYSPYIYLDDLLAEMSHTNVGCFWDIFAAAIVHVMLLVPTPFALKKLLAIAM